MTCEPTLIVLCGMPASGKSSWAAQQRECTVVSCDAVRAGEQPVQVFNVAHERARTLLLLGSVVIFDACSLQAQARARLLHLGRDTPAGVSAQPGSCMQQQLAMRVQRCRR